MCTAWAAGFVFVKFDEGGFPPLMIAAGRSLLAAGGIIAFCAITRQQLRPAFRRSPQMLLLGVLGPGAVVRWWPSASGTSGRAWPA